LVGFFTATLYNRLNVGQFHRLLEKHFTVQIKTPGSLYVSANNAGPGNPCSSRSGRRVHIVSLRHSPAHLSCSQDTYNDEYELAQFAAVQLGQSMFFREMKYGTRDKFDYGNALPAVVCKFIEIHPI